MAELVIVTDNRMAAECAYPGKRIVSSVGGVLDLKNGTQIILHTTRVGAAADSPVTVARELIKRGVYQEVDG